MQGHERIVAHDFCVAHREANSGLSTLNRAKSILSIYHQQRQLQKQRGMCLNDTYPFCQQPLSDNCHSICFSKPVLWAATPKRSLLEKNLWVWKNFPWDGQSCYCCREKSFFQPPLAAGMTLRCKKMMRCITPVTGRYKFPPSPTGWRPLPKADRSRRWQLLR